MSVCRLDSDRTALLVIDVQRGFDLWEARGMRRNNPEALARIADLLTLFREHGAPVFHIRHAGSTPGSAFLPDSAGYEVQAGAREIPGEPVLVKSVNSAFIGTDLEKRLCRAGINTVVLCGATTNHCVETTARMAGNLGFETLLPRDATWTYDRAGVDREIYPAEQIHAMTLANLQGEFAAIVSSTAIFQALRPAI